MKRLSRLKFPFFKEYSVRGTTGVKLAQNKAEVYSYGKPAKKPILEKIYQAIENFLHMFDLKSYGLNENNPWEGIIADSAFTPIHYRPRLEN